MGKLNVPSVAAVFCRHSQLKLDAIDAVNAVDEEDQDEHKGDLQDVLRFCYERAFGDEAVWFLWLDVWPGAEIAWAGEHT